MWLTATNKTQTYLCWRWICLKIPIEPGVPYVSSWRTTGWQKFIQIYYWVRGRDRRKLRQEGGVCNDHALRVHSVDSSNLECKYASTWLLRNSLFIRWLFPFKSNDPQLHATVHWIKHKVIFVGVQLVRCPTELFMQSHFLIRGRDHLTFEGRWGGYAWF